MSATYFDFALGVIKVIGPLVLLGALAYAVLRWRSRSGAADDIGERKTRELYTDERAQRDNLLGEEAGGPPSRPT